MRNENEILESPEKVTFWRRTAHSDVDHAAPEKVPVWRRTAHSTLTKRPVLRGGAAGRARV